VKLPDSGRCVAALMFYFEVKGFDLLISLFE